MKFKIVQQLGTTTQSFEFHIARSIFTYVLHKKNGTVNSKHSRQMQNIHDIIVSIYIHVP